MRTISGIDSLFLEQETPQQHMHVGGLGIYDPSTAPGGKVRFKQVLEYFTRQMSKHPVYRRKIVPVPFNVGRPVLVDSPDVDVEYHVRHLALPEPGDWRQLMIQIARIHSRPLDRSMPMWEAYIIEGLDSIEGLPKGCFALYMKFHHALIDGEAGAHLIGSMHTLTPEFTPVEPEEAPTKAIEEPSESEILSAAMAGRYRQALEAGSLGVSMGRAAVQTAVGAPRKLAQRTEDLVRSQFTRETGPKTDRPATRFNDSISAHRVLEAAPISMQAIQELRRNVEGLTVNDIFLTVVGGAMVRYLDAHGESVKTSLRGTMPMTLRGEDKSADVGNQIAQVYYSLRTDIKDPIRRARAISAETLDVKRNTGGALGRDVQMRLLEVLPVNMIASLLTREMGSKANVNVSNVRGPDQALYLAGARLERFLPFSIAIEGCGLNLTAFSYHGTFWIAITCCRDMMPDPAFFVTCLQESFEDLYRAGLSGGKRPAKRGRTSGSGARKSTAAKKSATKAKASSKPKSPAKRKAPVKKKTPAGKKAAASRKAPARKKAPAKKKASARTQPATRTKTAAKKTAGAKKRAVPKTSARRKSAARRRA
jgi:diacylglycerol O-acyltransferase